MITIEKRHDGDFELVVNGRVEEWGSLPYCVRRLQINLEEYEEEFSEE